MKKSIATWMIEKRNRFLIILITLCCHTTVFGQTAIQAENYTSMSGVQTETTSDTGGGLNVGWIDNTDWMTYSVNLSQSGYYLVQYRVASNVNTGVIILSQNGTDLKTDNVPQTGGYQSWLTMGTLVYLNAGQQNLTLYARNGGFNINWWKLTLSTNTPDTQAPAAPTGVAVSAGNITATVNWSAATDNFNVINYNIYINNTKVATTSGLSYFYNALAQGTSYTVGVSAVDAAGNESVKATKTFTTTGTQLQLTWADEFNYSGLPDSTKWNFESGGGGWGNNELQYYTSKRLENARVENGNLIIEARKEAYQGSSYTSARLNSSGKGDALYGRWEARAILPEGRGNWSAIWALPTDWVYGGWPKSGEIDLMEHVGYDYGNVHASTHSQTFNFQTGGNPTSSYFVPDASSAYHVYAMDWTPDYVKVYVDDVLIFTSPKNGTWEAWPFDQRFHWMLNIAIGGNWGGIQGIDDAAFPQKMQIDYVRIYKMNFPVDNTAPSAPTQLVSNDVTPSSIQFSWSPSADNFSVNKYNVYKNGTLVGSTQLNTYFVNGLSPLTSYQFSVEAVDVAGNVSPRTSFTVSTINTTTYSVANQIEAENFNAMNGVQKETTTDVNAGQNVGWIEVGDWMEYSINVLQAGRYKIDFRIASGGTVGGEVQLLDKNQTVLTSTILPVTGGWQTWQTVTSAEFNLTQGVQNIRISPKTAGFNINWFKFTYTSNALPSVSLSAPTNNASFTNYNPIALTALASDSDGSIAKVEFYQGTTLVGTSTTSPYTVNWTPSANGNYTFTAKAYDNLNAVTTSATSTISVYKVVSLPGKQEAENYYSMFGVQTETCTEGGLNVGYLDVNDSLVYRVNVTAAGMYSVGFRVASLNGGGKIQVKNGGTVLATFSVDATGGWQTWTNTYANVNLTAGIVNLTVKIVTGGFNLNYIDFASTSAFTSRIEAENYLQMYGVQKETCTEGGQNVGWIDNNDWMVYSVNIPVTGAYKVSYRVASPNSTGSIRLDKDAGATVLGTTSVPSTGGWQTWTTITQTVTLPAGQYNLGINALVGAFNLNWIEISNQNVTLKQLLTTTENTPAKHHNHLEVRNNSRYGVLDIALSGYGKNEPLCMQIFDISGKAISNQTIKTDADGNRLLEVDSQNLPAGVYFVRVGNANSLETQKILIGKQ